jgi:tetratricopeptide (TPR) repeat protein
LAAPGVATALPRAGVAAALAAAVLVATAAAYAPSLDGELQFDDWTAIESNWALRDPGRLLRGVGPTTLLGPSRIVTELTFALDLPGGRVEPRRLHRTGLLLHLGVSALVLALALGALRAAGHPRSGALAALAAAAFALHPLQTEAVCYAAQRAEVLASLLYLAGLLALLRADAAWPRGRAFGWMAGAAALHALALGAKPIAVTLPAAFLLYRAVLGGSAAGAPPLRARALRALAVAAPCWALSLASAALTLGALGPGDSAGLHAGPLGPWRYLLTQWKVHGLYAALAIWPAGQNVDHDLSPSPGLLDPATVAAGLGLALVVAGAVALWRRAEQGRAGPAARVAAFGVGLFLLALLPTSSVVPIADVVAEHRVYLALAGLLLALAVGLDAALAAVLPPARLPVALGLAGAVACGALALALHARATLWGSPIALWADAAAKSPDKARPLANHAFALHGARRYQEAIAAYARARALARTPVEAARVGRNLAGLYLDGLGDPAAALAVVDAVLPLAPGDVDLRRNRALALHALGRIDEAWKDARFVAARAPGEPVVQDLLGLLHVEGGDLDQAAAAFRRARELDPAEPNYAEHHFLALFHAGRRAEACAAWRARVSLGGTPGQAASARAAEAGCAARGPAGGGPRTAPAGAGGPGRALTQ